MNDKSYNTRLFVGGLLVLVGVLLFLSINDILSFRFQHIVFSFPFFIFVVGILILLNSRKRTLGGVLTVVGAFFLIPRIFPWIHFEGSLIFPLILIGLGIAIIIKQRKPVNYSPSAGQTKEFGSTSYETSEDLRKDYIDDVAIFGGGTKILISDNFKGGNITAIFGGSEIDLSRSKLAEGEHVLDVLYIFGGSDIYVPKEWNIIANVTPVFGGFSNKVIRDPELVIDRSKTLVIKGLALFGGGEVKNKF
jgi:predicted membrane protein